MTHDAPENDRPSILLVEDDERLASLVAEYLGQNGLEVSVEPRGDRAVARVLATQPDAVVLDIMLPGLDGLSVCRQLRPSYRGGILMLTARGDEVDEVVGLELGADDYIAKPVKPRLLLARLQALLRRVGQRGSAAPPAAADGAPMTQTGSGSAPPRKVTIGALVVDAASRVARLDGDALKLTTAEFDLLWHLACHAGEVLSREDLYSALMGTEYDGLDRSIDLRVARLRRKLGDDATDPVLLKSVRGVGYLLAAPS